MSVTNPTSTNVKAEKSFSPAQQAWQRLLANKAALISMIVLLFIVFCCVGLIHISPWELDEVDWENFGTPPSFAGHHYFGTDANGRDLFVRTLYGGRIS